MSTEQFINDHRNEDVRSLALKAPRDGSIDVDYAIEQISGWQKARTKLPEWAAEEGIVYPPHISMEQCSSEKTARYKAGVAQRLLDGSDGEGKTVLTDLTGGFGVDFSYMARMFKKAVYVERQSRLCDVARHNFKVLGITQAEVVNADSEQYLSSMGHSDIIFIDPARRDLNGARTFAISDCTPDVIAMKDALTRKAESVMVKLSPMLDWRKAVADLGGCVGEVHIVSAGNECKELLLIMSRRFKGLQTVFCINDGQHFSFTPEEAAEATRMRHSGNGCLSEADSSVSIQQKFTGKWLMEPNPSVMKAGCFALAASRYGAEEISKDSHLFVSDERPTDFPGRIFKINAVTTMNKRELKAALGGIRKANITVRNFPMSVAELRKRLKTGDGGDTYIFATTTANGSHILLVCGR